MQSFGIGIEWSGDAVHLHLRGELDISVGDDLVERVEALAESSARVALLDLSEVTFVDSSGLRALLSAQRSADDAGDFEVILVRAPQVVRDVMAITGTDRLLHLEETRTPLS